MAEVLAALAEQAAITPAGDWVFGFNYDDTLLAEKRHPTRAELDAVSTQHPVVASHVSGHMMVANSLALEAIGVNAETPDPEGGVIGRLPGSTEPNGLLEETARLPLMVAMQDVSLLDTYRLMKSAANEYSAVGVTTAQSGTPMPPDRIDLVNKDYARRMLLGLLKHIAYPRSAYAHEHFHELGTGDAEKRDACFRGSGTGQ